MLRPYGILLLQVRPALRLFGHAQDNLRMRRRRNSSRDRWSKPRAFASEGGQGADGADDIFGLGQDCVFEFWLVGAEGVGSGDAADGSVEVFE
jgi:hypothetical protein